MPLSGPRLSCGQDDLDLCSGYRSFCATYTVRLVVPLHVSCGGKVVRDRFRLFECFDYDLLDQSLDCRVVKKAV